MDAIISNCGVLLLMNCRLSGVCVLVCITAQCVGWNVLFCSKTLTTVYVKNRYSLSYFLIHAALTLLFVSAENESESVGFIPCIHRAAVNYPDITLRMGNSINWNSASE